MEFQKLKEEDVEFHVGIHASYRVETEVEPYVSITVEARWQDWEGSAGVEIPAFEGGVRAFMDMGHYGDAKQEALAELNRVAGRAARLLAERMK